MQKINYQFSDGHYEEIEVTEEFAQAYEEIDKQTKGMIKSSIGERGIKNHRWKNCTTSADLKYKIYRYRLTNKP